MVHDFLAARPADEPIMASLRALMIAIAKDLPVERHLLAAQHRWCKESDDLLAAIRNHHAAIVDLLAEFIAPRLETPDPVGGRAAAVATACIASAGVGGHGLDRAGRGPSCPTSSRPSPASSRPSTSPADRPRPRVAGD